MWSLACLEKRTGLSFFKPASLMDRMKYRYDREEAAGRSVLRRLVEKDVGAGVPMVLVVAEVAVAATSLLFTDGWYSLPCNIEPGSPLQQLVQKKMIVEGTKVVTQGAELLGGEEGCHPLQAEDRSLKLHVNSTRRVRCNARLGQCPPIAVGLRGLLEGGGATALMRLKVVRTYPVMYSVKEAGKSKFLTEKEWEKMRSKSGGAGVQKIYSEVEERVQKEEGIVGERQKVRERDLAGLECGEELLRLITAAGDPGLVACLNQEQREAMEQAGRRRSDRVRQRVEEEVQGRLREERKATEAVPMLKVRVVDARPEEEGSPPICSAILTVWRPTGDADMLREGRLVDKI